MNFFIAGFVMPIINFPFLIVVSFITVSLFLLGVKQYKITVKDNEEIKGDVSSIAITVSLFSALAQGVVAPALFFLTGNIYLFGGVASEWGLQTSRDFFGAILYYLIWNILYVIIFYNICRKQMKKLNEIEKVKKLFAFTGLLVGFIVFTILSVITILLNN